MSKSQRKRAEKRKRAANRARPLGAEDVEVLPRPLRLIAEGYESLTTLLAGATSADDALDSSRKELRAVVERIVAAAEEFDIFDVVERLRMAESPLDPETYSETEHEGMASAIELGALVLGARGTRHGTGTTSGGYRARADGVIGDLQALTHKALDAGSMLMVITAITSGDADADLALGAVLREVFVRNLVYPHMLEVTLAGLFDDAGVEADCRAAMGCSVAEVRRAIAAMGDLRSERWQVRMESMQKFVAFTRETYEAYVSAAQEAARSGDEEHEVTEEVRAKAHSLFDSAWANPADASTIDVDAIAERSGLKREVVASVINLFCLDLTPRDAADVAMEFVAGRSPLRTRPILRDPDGSAMAVHDGLLLPAVRDRVEELLKPTPGWDGYAKHRGEYLERAGLSLLSSLLPDADVYASIEYFVPEPSKSEASPDKYTKLVEGDGLLVVDDIAVVLEAKGGALGPESRAGDRHRLRADIRKLVTDASHQANRVRDRIEADHGLRLRDGTWLDLSSVREIHAVAVTLEDLSSITTATVSLINAGLLAVEDVPWTVSLHDLQVIRDLVDRPAEFLLYLRRRTEPTVTRRYHAVDELDLFLEFFATGLYVEPDPEKVRKVLPHLGEPSVAEKRRFKSQGINLLTSRTDQLDAWYLHKLGMRKTPAPKPAHNANPRVRLLVDALAETRVDGWLSIGATLLAGSSALQRRFASAAEDLAKLTRRDGRSHSYTMFVGGSGPDSALLVWASIGVDETAAAEAPRLREYLRAKKHQMQAASAVCMVFAVDDTIAPAMVIYENNPPGPNAELDRVVTNSNLRPVTRAIDRRPGSRRR